MPEVTSKVHSFLPQEKPGAQSRLTRPVHQDHWLGDPPLQKAGCPPPFRMRWGPSPPGSLPPKVPLRCPCGSTPLSLDRPHGRLPSLWVSPAPDLPSPDPPPPAVPKSSSVPGLPCSQVPHHPQPHCPQISLLLRGSLVPRSPTAGPRPWPDWSSLTARRLADRRRTGAEVRAAGPAERRAPPGEPRVSFDQIRRRSLGGAGQAGGRPRAQGGAGDPGPLSAAGVS